MAVCVSCSCLLWLASAAAASEARQAHAVVLVYHHVATDTPSSTSVTPARFAEHLQLLEDGGFKVIDLAALVDDLRAGRGVPERAVALTFDDAWRSIHTTARPLLEARSWPYTIFVSTAAVDQGLRGYMNWSDLRLAAAGGARIANHSDTHSHLLAREAAETEAQWHARVVADIHRASRRIEAEVGVEPRMFAWPYGEFDARLLGLLDELGLVGFGQQSGPMGGLMGLPVGSGALARFPVSGRQSALEALKLRLHTAPLPAEVVVGDWRLLHDMPDAPLLTLDLGGGLAAGQLSCFLGTGERLRIAPDPERAGRVRVRADTHLAAGRSKYTCTAPRGDQPGAWYWYSHPWFVPTALGAFPD